MTKTQNKLKITTITFFTMAFFFSAFSFANADITTGLVGHWKFDETSGTTANDSAGANNGTL